ncbi:photosystem i assembly protein ycf4 [Phtheirospermum japonicum]|uniref:Photosystem I assembly protein Ycf4 n=1 Tax=Phtheirospermum japonicum TaxID=374723 RepID=A0A830BWB7_9LAMI|nr:photosystem i assembly protein ycf4 [Phtheirospermum japonicum]GFQ08570.1 photosystem i assembly protein ycf4 [Phtheirospermum japonicum]
MSWRSEQIWIELITGSRKLSNFCWALIVFLGSLGFLLVGTSSYLGKNLISFVPPQQIIFFPQGIVMSFYGIAVRIEVKEGIYARRVLYMDIRGRGAIPLTRTDENLTPREIEQKAAELAYFLRVPIEVF